MIKEVLGGGNAMIVLEQVEMEEKIICRRRERHKDMKEIFFLKERELLM